MQTGSKGGLREEVPMHLEELLENIDYPVNKSDLIEKAKKSRGGGIPKNEGEDAVLANMLQRLGMLSDREYKSRDDVASELEKR